jgi:hypothetical protein
MLKLALQSETLQNGETSRNYNWQFRIPPTASKKTFITGPYKVSQTFGDYSLSKFKQSKAVLRKFKTELSVTQNNLVIKLLYTVEFGGPEGSVSIY